MIKHPQQENRRYATPKAETIKKIPDGTEMRCQSCKRDLFGIFKDGVLEIRYRGREITMRTGEVSVKCRSCRYETTINLKAIKVNLNVYDDETQVINITRAALKLAEERGVKIRNVVGSGKGGSITISDIREYIACYID